MGQVVQDNQGKQDIFKARSTFDVNGKQYTYYDLQALAELGLGNVAKLPFSIKILLESLLRQYDGEKITREHIINLAKWGTNECSKDIDVPFKPTRVVLQDFTGIPVVVDLASLREAMAKMGGDPSTINPEIPVDLVIDHAEQVDQFGTPNALQYNVDKGFQLNLERYSFFKWATKSIANFRAVPPSTGIIHQVNLEYLASVVQVQETESGASLAFPDTCFGTDSHTPMINGLGIVGWGVGGIEAEAAMLGYPSCISIPEVIGIQVKGQLPVGATGTDLALYVTHWLRHKKVVGKFVEFFGEGLRSLSLADRATVANMSPESGATITYFPVDEATLDYLRLTGRSEEQISLVESYCKQNGLFYTTEFEEANYSEVLTLNLEEIETSVAGPKRPQDIIPLSQVKKVFQQAVTHPLGNQGYGLEPEEVGKKVVIQHPNSTTSSLTTGSVVLAAITSCTNTSNPSVMIGAGLLAKKAVEKGLTVPPYVKTSLAPGSKVVTEYLRKAGLLPYLEQLGFYLVGYGCTTCVGNSGPLPMEVEKVIVDQSILVVGVLSGNRNFEGRIHPLIKANYLASPPLVVAYALAGSVNLNLQEEALGQDQQGEPVYLFDLWPTEDEIQKVMQECLTADLFVKQNESIFSGNRDWNQLQTISGMLYQWEEDSTYIQDPPFFEKMSKEAKRIEPLKDLRVLVKLGDSITTDHISPAGGKIPEHSVAGEYLREKGVLISEFSSYGARRGNHNVMLRGFFANIHLRNQLTPNKEGNNTLHFPTGEVLPIYQAARRYQQEQTGLVILAGHDYGMGSSRDWAAKATSLLGVKAVMAQGFERIHRSNLALMGVMPLQFREGESADSLGITGEEHFQIQITEDLKPRQIITVLVENNQGVKKEFEMLLRFDSVVEIEYYRHGGVLQMVLRKKLEQQV